MNAPLHDSNFDVDGVKEVLAAVRSRFPDHRLVAAHPNCGHDFPPEVRKQAYQFLEQQLKKKRP